MARTSKKPKHRQIYEFVHSGILAGRYAVGDRIPTEMELAERFDVTRLTAARALQDLARAGFVRRQRRVGTVVQEIPREGEPRGEGNLLAIVVPRRGDIGLRDLGDAIAQKAGHHGLGVLSDDVAEGKRLSDEECTSAAIKRAEALCRQYVKLNVMGVFVVPLPVSTTQQDSNPEMIAVFRRAGLTVVLLERDISDYPHRSGFDLIMTDARQAGYAMTSHLISLAYRRIGFVARPSRTSSTAACMAGYRDALLTMGNCKENELIWRGDVRDKESVQGLLDDCGADAYVCEDDETAAHLMLNLVALDVRVPDDVALVGMGDAHLTTFLPVALTTMRYPYERAAEAAVRMMQDRLGEPELEARQMQFTAKLVIRESCGAARRTVATDEDRRLLMIAEPVLRTIHQQTGETVNLGVGREGRITYISVLESRHALRRVGSPQGVDPLHTTALGRAILCHLPVTEQEALLKNCRLEKRTPFTEVDTGRLREILREARERGYAVERDQTDVGVTCVGAPVFSGGRVTAAISVSVPTARVDAIGVERFIRDVVEGANQVTTLLNEKEANGYGES